MAKKAQVEQELELSDVIPSPLLAKTHQHQRAQSFCTAGSNDFELGGDNSPLSCSSISPSVRAIPFTKRFTADVAGGEMIRTEDSTNATKGEKYLLGNVLSNSCGSTRTNSRVYSIFLLLNSMIGSGVFNIPHVFSKAGLVSSYVLLTFSAVLVYLGLVVLVQVSEFHPELKDYAALAEHVFDHSPWASRLVDFFIMVIGFGSLLSYIAAISSIVHELLLSWSAGHVNHLLVTSGIMVVFVFPLCLQRYYGHFSFISIFSMGSVGCVLALVVVGGQFYAAEWGGGGGPGFTPVLVRGNPVTQLGSVIFTFSCASATFHTFKYMKVKTVQEWRIVCRWTVFLGWLLCMAMGTGGYLAFGTKTNGIILANFRRGHVGDFFQILFILHLVLYIPLDFLVARHSLLRMCGYERGAFVNNKHHVLLCFVLLAIFVTVIFVLDGLGLVLGDIFSAILNFTGGLGGSVISFVLPAAMFLRQRFRGSGGVIELLPCAFMLFVGIAIALYVPTITVMNSVSANK